MTTALRDLTRESLHAQARAAGVASPGMRFWGERKPPKSRTDMFAVSVRSAADGDASTSSGAAAAGQVATLRIYGPIDSWGGWWGISAAEVGEALDALPADVTEIRARINSPGGEVWEGLAITNMLRAHPARVVAVVDGLAASAASLIACAMEETVMSPGTQMMIHDASAFAYGPAAVMRKAAGFLDTISNASAELYAEAAGGTTQSWRDLMVEETWYTAQEAAAAGLADRVGVVPDVGASATAGSGDDLEDDSSGEDVDAAVEELFDLRIFQHAGRSAAPAPTLPVASAAGSTSSAAGAPSSRDTTQEGDAAVNFTDEQLTTLRQSAGVSADADADTIVAGLVEALDERAEPAAANPPGTVVLDEATVAQLRADAAAGRTALETQQRQEREATVTAAVRDGRIPVSRRDHWVAQLEADPEGAGQVLASLAAGTIPVEELGHGDGADKPLNEADTLVHELYGTEKEA